MKYEYQAGDLVTLHGAGYSKFRVDDVRGEKLLIQMGSGPCLIDATECEPVNFDRRRMVEEDYA